MLPPSCLSALRARPNERQIHPKCVAMRTTRIEALSELPAGAGCQEKQNLPAKGKVFLLDIPFYRTRQAILRVERDKLVISQSSGKNCGQAHGQRRCDWKDIDRATDNCEKYEVLHNKNCRVEKNRNWQALPASVVQERKDNGPCNKIYTID